MAFPSGLSNFGQAYRIGQATQPFFSMQGMLPMAGLQPGGVIPGAGTGAPILPEPMLPGGPSAGALPAMLPGLGAAMPKPVAQPKPVATQTVRQLKERDPGRGIDAKADRDARGGMGGKSGGFGSERNDAGRKSGGGRAV